MKKFMIMILLMTSFSIAGEIEVNENKDFSAGYRILVESVIKDKYGIVEARAYFKSKEQRVYHCFSKMKCKGENCIGVLPRPSKFTKDVNYIVLYQNTGGQIYKTKEFTISSKEMLELPKWQVFSTKRLDISTEFFKIPRKVYGFDDKVRIETVLNEEKLGYKADILTGDMVGLNDKSKVSGKYVGEVKQSEISSYKFLTSPYTIGTAALLLLL